MSMEAFRGRDELPANENGLKNSMVRSVQDYAGKQAQLSKVVKFLKRAEFGADLDCTPFTDL